MINEKNLYNSEKTSCFEKNRVSAGKLINWGKVEFTDKDKDKKHQRRQKYYCTLVMRWRQTTIAIDPNSLYLLQDILTILRPLLTQLTAKVGYIPEILVTMTMMESCTLWIGWRSSLNTRGTRWDMQLFRILWTIKHECLYFLSKCTLLSVQSYQRTTVQIRHVAEDANDREHTQLGRERRRERHKTIDLITEYNDFTWERNQLATFPSSSFVNRTRKAQFCGFRRTWTTRRMNHFNLHAVSKLKFLISYVHTASSKIK